MLKPALGLWIVAFVLFSLGFNAFDFVINKLYSHIFSFDRTMIYANLTVAAIMSTFLAFIYCFLEWLEKKTKKDRN